jgi:polar amino acid transport system substrate-binding protein
MTIVLGLCTLALLAAGCTPSEPEIVLEPVVEPPVIGEAGMLRAGVDMEYPPFAGTDKGREAGLDIDVASALATELGLDLKTVDVKPSEAATALADGSVDVVLSVPFSEESLVSASLAGTYATNGPGFFISVEDTSAAGSAEDTGSAGSEGEAEDEDAQDEDEDGESVEDGASEEATATDDFVPTITLDTAGAEPIGVQEGSEAYWILQYELGEDTLVVFPTLREALDALDAGAVGVVAGDAFVGAYVARDYDGIEFAGQVGPATPLGVAVAQDATDLEEAVREAMDALAADGVFDAIRQTWVGDLPPLETEAAE